ncbi:vWA domain-containing protein [Maribacter sp. 2307ULW6-5]|uniref:vWA domain-containing protein n=1 Tax=Maribacter sp. 2307ULW6-5 TaxID=3386275 RepID=UPI0039BCC2F9
MKKYHSIGLCLLAALFLGHSRPNDAMQHEKAQEKRSFIPSHIDSERKDGASVKIALLLDTSNSMDGLINQAKSQLWDIVNEFTHARCGNGAPPKLQIALYQYGNDNLSSREGYIQQVLDFSSDLDEISEKLFSLTTHGGEEYCGAVINTSLKQLDWGSTPGDLKMIFIAGNEPFDQGRQSYVNAALNAKEKDVVVNTIFCGNHALGVRTQWKKGAQLTGGEYMAIDHNRDVVHISTPYDDVILKLNTKLNKTYISFGSLGASKFRKQAVQDANAMEMEEAVAVKRAVSKSSRLYSNKAWDLVDATTDESFDLSQLDKDALPKELRNKSKEEMEAIIEAKRKEREAIQKEIQDLDMKRKEYMAQKQEDASQPTLESAMVRAIKRQALAKHIRW